MTKRVSIHRDSSQILVFFYYSRIAVAGPGNRAQEGIDADQSLVSRHPFRRAVMLRRQLDYDVAAFTDQWGPTHCGSCRRGAGFGEPSSRGRQRGGQHCELRPEILRMPSRRPTVGHCGGRRHRCWPTGAGSAQGSRVHSALTPETRHCTCWAAARRRCNWISQRRPALPKNGVCEFVEISNTFGVIIRNKPSSGRSVSVVVFEWQVKF